MFVFYQFKIYTPEVQKIRHLLSQRGNEYPLAMAECLVHWILFFDFFDYGYEFPRRKQIQFQKRAIENCFAIRIFLEINKPINFST